MKLFLIALDNGKYKGTGKMITRINVPAVAVQVGSNPSELAANVGYSIEAICRTAGIYVSPMSDVIAEGKEIPRFIIEEGQNAFLNAPGEEGRIAFRLDFAMPGEKPSEDKEKKAINIASLGLVESTRQGLTLLGEFSRDDLLKRLAHTVTVPPPDETEEGKVIAATSLKIIEKTIEVALQDNRPYEPVHRRMMDMSKTVKQATEVEIRNCTGALISTHRMRDPDKAGILAEARSEFAFYADRRYRGIWGNLFTDALRGLCDQEVLWAICRTADPTGLPRAKLSGTEMRILLVLSEGPLTGAMIASKTNIMRPNIYSCLPGLLQKGYVVKEWDKKWSLTPEGLRIVHKL